MKIKHIITITLAAVLLMSFFGCVDEKDPEPEPTLPPGPYTEPDYPDNITLHTMWPFPVGVAVPGARTSNSNNNNVWAANNPQYKFLKHFNVVVAENEMKPEAILGASRPQNKEPSEWAVEDFNWVQADQLVTYAKTNGSKIRGHTLIWHSQTSGWFFRNADNTALASKDELYAHMENYIRVVFEKYGGSIGYWDVVNEVVAQDTSGPRPTGEGSKYYEIMDADGKTGMDLYEFVLKAFQWARQYADVNDGEDVKMYLTDFGVERPFTRNGKTKQGDFLALVNWLVQNDAPIDGVGFQGHFRLYDHPVTASNCLNATCISKGGAGCTHNIEDGIKLFSNITRKDGEKLKIQICEFDVSIFSSEKKENTAKIMENDKLGERLTDLAKTYRDFFNLFEKYYNQNVIDMVVIWGIADRQSWLNKHPVSGRTDYPLLFNRNYMAKEAYVNLTTNRPGFPK